MTGLLVLKFVHVLAAITAVGANLTYSFWLARAGQRRDRLVWTIETIRQLDRRIANPAYGVLLLTGIWMVLAGAFPLQTGWIVAALVLYVAVAVIGIAAFAPAIRRQLAEAELDPTSPAYAEAARRSNTLGLITTATVLVIVYLMVVKPF